MKYIIVYEDDTRALLFKTNDENEWKEWMESTINQIINKGGEVSYRFNDAAWGTVNDMGWIIVVYNDYEIDNLKPIVV